MPALSPCSERWKMHLHVQMIIQCGSPLDKDDCCWDPCRPPEFLSQQASHWLWPCPLLQVHCCCRCQWTLCCWSWHWAPHFECCSGNSKRSVMLLKLLHEYINTRSGCLLHGANCFFIIRDKTKAARVYVKHIPVSVGCISAKQPEPHVNTLLCM